MTTRRKFNSENLLSALKRFRFVAFTGVMLALLLVVTSSDFRNFKYFSELEHSTLTLRLRLRGIEIPAPSEPPIVIVAIDDYSLTTELSRKDLIANPDAAYTQEPWPWNRTVHARLAERLFEAGARIVALDLVFPGPNPGDEAFYEAISTYENRLIIGFDYTPYESELGEVKIQERLPYDDLLPEQGALDFIGFVNVARDEDGVLRKAKLTSNIYHENVPFLIGADASRRAQELAQSSAGIPAFGTRIALTIQPEIEATLPPLNHLPYINYAGPSGYFPVVSFLDVLLTDRFQHHKATFHDAIVIVGPFADFFKDVVATPLGDMYGVESHAHVVRSLLNNSFYQPASGLSATLLTLGSALITFLIGSFVRSAPLKVTLAGGAVIGFGAIVYGAFSLGKTVLPTLPGLLTITLGSSILIAYDFILDQYDRKRLKSYLGRYVSAEVAEILAENRAQFKELLEGASRPMTILFSDIRGFTSLSEKYTPKGLVAHLNEYFEGVVGAILDSRGSLNKYIGDAIFAVWGDIYSEGPKADCLRAVLCALEIKKVVQQLNEGWKNQPGKHPLVIGIGLSHGEGFIGNMGHPSRMEVAVMGDVVNLGSRLEGATKQYHTDILVSDAVYQHCNEVLRFQELDIIQVKGKTVGVGIYTPINFLHEEEPEWFLSWQAALNSYRNQAFVDALAEFRSLAMHFESLKEVAGMYCERCESLIATPPPKDWDCIFVMTSK